jgi:hypothetical protein
MIGWPSDAAPQRPVGRRESMWGHSSDRPNGTLTQRRSGTHHAGMSTTCSEDVSPCHVNAQWSMGRCGMRISVSR